MKFSILFVLFAVFSAPVLSYSRIEKAIHEKWRSRKFQWAVHHTEFYDLISVLPGGGTLLHLAAMKNRAAQLQVLLNTPLKELVEATDSDAQTAIEVAIMHRSFDAFSVLWEHYHLSGILAEDETYLHYAARQDKDKQLEILLDTSLEDLLWETNRDGLTPIEVAITAGNFDAFLVLLKHHNINDRFGERGWTLAHLAAWHDQPEMLWALHRAGHAMNTRDISQSRMRPIEAASLAGANRAIAALMQIEPTTPRTPRSNSLSKFSITPTSSSPLLRARSSSSSLRSRASSSSFRTRATSKTD